MSFFIGIEMWYVKDERAYSAWTKSMIKRKMDLTTHEIQRRESAGHYIYPGWQTDLRDNGFLFELEGLLMLDVWGASDFLGCKAKSVEKYMEVICGMRKVSSGEAAALRILGYDFTRRLPSPPSPPCTPVYYPYETACDVFELPHIEDPLPSVAEKKYCRLHQKCLAQNLVVVNQKSTAGGVRAVRCLASATSWTWGTR